MPNTENAVQWHITRFHIMVQITSGFNKFRMQMLDNGQQ